MLNRLNFEVVGSLHTYRGGVGLCGNCNFCMSKINIGRRHGGKVGGVIYGVAVVMAVAVRKDDVFAAG